VIPNPNAPLHREAESYRPPVPNFSKPASLTRKSWREILPFPLALLAFAGVGVRYFNIVFTTNTRWLFLALLIALLLLQRRIFSGFKSRFGWVLALYFIWSLGTVLWSEVPNLSLLKSVALILTTSAFLSGGYYWATAVSPDKTFTYLIPLTCLALIASLAGAGGRPADIHGLRLYEGLAGNSNFLGMLVAIGTPFLLLQLYRAFFHRCSFHVRALLVALAGCLGAALVLSASRASMLCALITIFFAVVTLTANKKAIVVLILSFVSLSTVLILPQIQTSIYRRLVVKGNQHGEIFFSRYGPWKESYDAALKGGYFGAGYGVSVGDTNFSLGLTAESYGREKGNSQLAIWEETGLVGLALYSILLFGILRDIYDGMSAARNDADLRFMLGVSFGIVLGMTAQSVFEAWWSAPGSLEAAAFWSVVGVGTGLSRRARASRRRNSVSGDAIGLAGAGSSRWSR
jgi:hypothetical protein